MVLYTPSHHLSSQSSKWLSGTTQLVYVASSYVIKLEIGKHHYGMKVRKRENFQFALKQMDDLLNNL